MGHNLSEASLSTQMFTLAVLFISFARVTMGIHSSSNSAGEGCSFPGLQQFISESYFSKYDSLVDSEFQDYLISKFHPIPGQLWLRLSALERSLIGEGSHRRLSTTIRLTLQADSKSDLFAQLCEVIMIERLPLGVFVDPFELEHLTSHGVFKGAAVFGDTNLELPSFRSNRSIVEVHIDAGLDKSSQMQDARDLKIEIPVHARYPPLEESGYSKVTFGTPELLICCKTQEKSSIRSCLFPPLAQSSDLKQDAVEWSMPAGINAHAGVVSAITFASALLSTVFIITASLQSSHLRPKQS